MSFGMGVIGLIFIGLGVTMFIFGLPRRGEAVARFLRGKDTLQGLYVMGIMAVMGIGIALVAYSILR